jgi:hypothetical protein
MLGLIGVPPRIADTDECAHRACLRMADVTVIHSVVIKATGSTATDTGFVLEFISVPFVREVPELLLLASMTEEDSGP